MLVQVKPPSHLNDLIGLCIRIDDCLTKQHSEQGPVPQALMTLCTLTSQQHPLLQDTEYMPIDWPIHACLRQRSMDGELLAVPVFWEKQTHCLEMP